MPRKRITKKNTPPPPETPYQDPLPVILHHPFLTFARYPTAAMARASLLDKFHDKIYTGPEDFKVRNDKEELKHILSELLKTRIDFKTKREYVNVLWPLIELRAEDKARLFSHPPTDHVVRNDSGETIERSKAEDVEEGTEYVSPHIPVRGVSAEDKERVGKLLERGYLPQFKPNDLTTSIHWSRLAPQAKTCMIIVATASYNQETDQLEVVSEKQLQKVFLQYRDMLRTKQDPWRIFQYYRSKLISARMLVMS